VMDVASIYRMGRPSYRDRGQSVCCVGIQPYTAAAFEAMLSDRDGPTRPNENLASQYKRDVVSRFALCLFSSRSALPSPSPLSLGWLAGKSLCTSPSLRRADNSLFCLQATSTAAAAAAAAA
jgi:hypothetical protein